MSSQTRAAFIAEYRAAVDRGDINAVIDLHFAAMDHDADHPDEPRLMDELRDLREKAAV